MPSATSKKKGCRLAPAPFLPFNQAGERSLRFYTTLNFNIIDVPAFITDSTIGTEAIAEPDGFTGQCRDIDNRDHFLVTRWRHDVVCTPGQQSADG